MAGKLAPASMSVVADFRRELIGVMPGYNWTVHTSRANETLITATGTQASGSNRLSTLHVTRREATGKISFEVKSAGFGARAPWLHVESDGTLKRALRSLQNHYESMARKYSSHAKDLQVGRIDQKDTF